MSHRKQRYLDEIGVRGPLWSTLGSPWVSRGCAFAAGQQLLRMTALACCKLRARDDLHLINSTTFCCLELEAHLCSVLVPALANTSADCWQEASRPGSVALSLCSLSVLATTSLRRGQSWRRGAAGWKKRWGSSSARRRTKGS